MIISRVSSKGQVTLPRKVRQALQLKPGDQVVFLLDEETVTLQPLGPSSARALLAGSGRLPRSSRRRSPVPRRKKARHRPTTPLHLIDTNVILRFLTDFKRLRIAWEKP
jgi:AbrB family looped-hinge helix DNA binding protein